MDSQGSENSPPVLGYSLGPGSATDIPGGTAPWAKPPSFSSAEHAPRLPGNLVAVPEPRSIPPVSRLDHFAAPCKRIVSRDGIDRFLQGESGQLYLAFLANLNLAIRGKTLSDPCEVSPAVEKILGVLEVLRKWIAELPPREMGARYGNPVYREWHERLEEQGPALMAGMLPAELHNAVVEIVPYFADSFGNSTRIDYGTGHEANFAAWLLCLVRLKFLAPGDYHALAVKVFNSYLSLMRELQTMYWLEPAGSHGVWGLDDYHFIPFILGASQLIGHKYMKPKSIHNADILEQYSKDYYYLACIAFIKQVKKGSLTEHSPMLNDISGVPNWEKVNSGMMKMYRAEVLEKVPIMQHFLFGTILPWR